MTTTMVDKRELIESIISQVTRDSGEVFAEDVHQLMTGLQLKPVLYSKASATLEEICTNRKIAEAFRDDPKWAYAKYVNSWQNTVMDLANTEYWVNHYTAEAEQGIALLIGLSVLS